MSGQYKEWEEYCLEYVIIQAGGKGTRMETLTANKPKALVPVNNLPMIFHVFKKFPGRKFIIIGDYKYDVLRKYLAAFAEVDYTLICSRGKEGTCAGLKAAISLIPQNEAFLLIWCDLVLADDYTLPDSQDNYIGISKDFICRWKYENNEFKEEPSSEFGVAGLFLFKDKSYLSDVPEEGEFVRWLGIKGLNFVPQPLYKSQEYGLKSEWEKLPVIEYRPFNRLEIKSDIVYKIPLDEQGRALAKYEVSWYKRMSKLGFQNLPSIYGYDPLSMEFIKGKKIYEYTDTTREKKREILKEIVSLLKSIHEIETIPADAGSYYEAYIGKTFNRLKKIRALVPFAENEYITVNNRKCRNVFFREEELQTAVMEYLPDKFRLIHGDCTFSNTLLKNDSIPILIDPRGYFGTTELFGDAAYDWAKLYYSLYSNYDKFNLKKYDLQINENSVNLYIESNNWEMLEDDFFNMIGGEISRRQMKLLLSIIWLSLTTYAWEDYDSICGAFYNGVYYLEEAFNGKNR